MTTVRAVTLDVGGPLYPDETFLEATTRALDELRSDSGLSPTPRRELRRIYDAIRAAQSGGLRRALAAEFLGDAELAATLQARTDSLWVHRPGSLYDDVLPALAHVATGRRLAILANQPGSVVDALHRDGVGSFVDVWAVSALVGYEKPSPELFTWALHGLGAEPRYTVHVGNRLDTDVRPARMMGMRAVWLLRGEAPDHPTPAQCAEADATISNMKELPAALAYLEGAETDARHHGS